MEGCCKNIAIARPAGKPCWWVAPLFSLLVCCAWAETVTDAAVTDTAVDEPVELPLIAIIIDDLGNQLQGARRTIELDGPVACAFMPHTRYAARLAGEAHAAGKEVMLHLPMQPMEMQRIAGPGEISLENGQSQLRRILDADLGSVPHVSGINNHMGSLITRHPGHMRWLMDELAARGSLFFVDSFTTPASVAYSTALERGVPAVRRHVFLDDESTPQAIARQFEQLKAQAARRGYAVGIGHPYAETLSLLETELPQLAAAGFRLVPVAEIVERLTNGDLEHDLPVRAQLHAVAQDAFVQR